MKILLSEYPATYCNESQQKPPKYLIEQTQCSASNFLKNAHNNIATLWRGDFHQAKLILNAAKKQLHQPFQAASTPSETFHKYRLMQSQRSRLLNMLLIEIMPNYQLRLPRTPNNITNVLTDIYADTKQQPSLLLPMNQLLGFIGAYEWHKKGITIPYLNHKIHVPFGVFAPLRNEYLDLIMQAPIPKHIHSAFDIGTGSGILAILLAQRGISKIIATDNNPRAILTAQNNINRFNYQQIISLQETDRLPEKTTDLIVCNPPWLPAKPTSSIETAVYDPQHNMLRFLLKNAHRHLNSQGELWLIISDIAEHLGLRQPQELTRWFEDNNWTIKQTLSIQPKHPKSSDTNNPLFFARKKETTYLYILSSLHFSKTRHCDEDSKQEVVCQRTITQ